MLFNTHPDESVHQDLSELGEPLSARAVLADKRGLSTSLAESLGSLGLGVLVMAGIAVGIGAAYNYGQDSSAKSTLDSVKAAEVLHKAKTGSYANAELLTTGADPALTKSSADLVINANEKDYCAVVTSRSLGGPSFWLTGRDGKVYETIDAANAAGTLPGKIACPAPAAG